jgi:hypothetical protein
VILPGIGIGKVRLGMTFGQVRDALGRPGAVLRRERFGFGSQYVEYAWRDTAWIVAVLGRGDRARVVSVSTTLGRERTPSRVGVGSTEQALRRTVGARCVGREAELTDWQNPDLEVCFLGRTRRAAHTLFLLAAECRIRTDRHLVCPQDQRVYRVYSVKVGEPRRIETPDGDELSFVWDFGAAKAATVRCHPPPCRP